jgi:hypothetical protein
VDEFGSVERLGWDQRGICPLQGEEDAKRTSLKCSEIKKKWKELKHGKWLRMKKNVPYR